VPDLAPLLPPLGTVYLHIPFCSKRCSWCHYYKEIDVDAAVIDRFPTLLARDLERVLARFGLERAPTRTLHYGGGTPSLLSTAQWLDLASRIAPLVEVAPGDEIAIECDPEDFDLEKARVWKETGVNRVSMGTQSFDDDVLRLLKRGHDRATARTSYARAVEIGFENINIDLMYGMPGRSLASWLADLREIVALRPESVTVYATRPEPTDALEKFARFPGDDERVFGHILAVCAFRSMGYAQYSPNQFIRTQKGACLAKAERNGCHDVLGVGPQAHSILRNWFFVNKATLRAYCELVERGELSPLKAARMPADDERVRFLQFGLKMSGVGKAEADNGVSLAAYRERFGEDALERFAPQIEFLRDEGLVATEGDSLHLEEPGIYLNRDVVRFFAMGA
jgi:oxygen-independent coproporphyrinogen-3 oxidase